MFFAVCLCWVSLSLSFVLSSLRHRTHSRCYTSCRGTGLLHGAPGTQQDSKRAASIQCDNGIGTHTHTQRQIKYTGVVQTWWWVRDLHQLWLHRMEIIWNSHRKPAWVHFLSVCGSARPQWWADQYACFSKAISNIRKVKPVCHIRRSPSRIKSTETFQQSCETAVVCMKQYEPQKRLQDKPDVLPNTSGLFVSFFLFRQWLCLHAFVSCFSFLFQGKMVTYLVYSGERGAGWRERVIDEEEERFLRPQRYTLANKEAQLAHWEEEEKPSERVRWNQKSHNKWEKEIWYRWPQGRSKSMDLVPSSGEFLIFWLLIFFTWAFVLIFFFQQRIQIEMLTC